MRLRVIFVTLLAVAGLVFIQCYSRDQSITLSFTEQEIQEKLGKKFPKTERIKGIIPVEITEPTITFIEGRNRIGIRLEASAIIPLKGKYQASLSFNSAIAFEAENKTLNLSDLVVEEVSATDLPEKYEPIIAAVSTLLAQKYLEGHEIYRLKDKDLKKKALKYLLKDVRIRDRKLEVKLGL